MTDKTVKKWEIRDPQGSLRETANLEVTAKVAFLRSTGENATDENLDRYWPEWEHLGYRAVRVRIEEIEDE